MAWALNWPLDWNVLMQPGCVHVLRTLPSLCTAAKCSRRLLLLVVLYAQCVHKKLSCPTRKSCQSMEIGQGFYLKDFLVKFCIMTPLKHCSLFLTFHVLDFEQNYKHEFTISIIPPYWYDAGSWYPLLCKKITFISYIVNITVVDALAPCVAKASATMILTVDRAG